MNRTPQAKSQAAILIREMNAAGIAIKNQQALEMVAKMSGFRDWNAMAAAPTVPVVAPPAAVARPTESYDPSRQIVLIWDVSDVQEVRPDLTEAEALDVLRRAKYKHDASEGVNWTTLAVTADWMYRERHLECAIAYVNDDNETITDEKAIVELKPNDGQGVIRLSTGGTLEELAPSEEGVVSFKGLPGQEFEATDGKLCGGDCWNLQGILTALQEAGVLPNVTIE